MRIQTLPKIVKIIKEIDPNTAINESMLIDLIEQGKIPYDKKGNRTVSDMDMIIPILNEQLGLDDTEKTPSIRTVRAAMTELKQKFPDIGIGEKQVRTAIENNQIDYIQIGNRTYIAMEFFNEPYVHRFSSISYAPCPKPKRIDPALEQFNQLMSKNTVIPKVKRVRNI